MSSKEKMMISQVDLYEMFKMIEERKHQLTSSEEMV